MILYSDPEIILSFLVFIQGKVKYFVAEGKKREGNIWRKKIFFLWWRRKRRKYIWRRKIFGQWRRRKKKTEKYDNWSESCLLNG